MAGSTSKTLTARVKLDTRDAETKIKNLMARIRMLTRALDKVANPGVEETFERTVTHIKKIDNKLTSVGSKTKTWLSNLRSTNSVMSSIRRTLGGILGTYLGLQTLKLGITSSDTITSAENKLNSLDGGNPKHTAEALDKMYAAAQRSRSSYSAMIDNVSKTMALSGDAFQGNIDNAIRFQEIMSKAYTIGGASEHEKTTSMYQLVQALGAGVLQGDELRSVREGAPIAYKEIEKFAQGVLHTDESLKDLASRGVITSDIIIAAIMNAEDKITDKFKDTDMTFQQAWDNIKNKALQAFKPVLQKLNDMLNSERGQKFIADIGNALVQLASIVNWLIDVFYKFFNWCVENWSWLKWVVVGAILAIIAHLLWEKTVAIATAIANILAMSAVAKTVLVIAIAIIALILIFLMWKTKSIDTCNAIAGAILVIALAVAVVAMLFGGWIVALIAGIVALLAVAFMFFKEVCGYANVAFQAVWQGIKWLGGEILGALWWIGALFKNIGGWFNNLWQDCRIGFWKFIGDILKGMTKVAEFLGIDSQTIEGAISITQSKIADAENKKKDIFQSGWGAEAFNRGQNIIGEQFKDGWATEAYNAGEAWGAGIEDKINKWGAQGQTSNLGIFDKINGLLDPNDSKYGVGGAYDPTGADADILDALEKINGDTSDIKDDLDLRDDDLEFLRRIAEMEWRNEFTTAEIRVEMTNNNTVNGERDLDGMVEYLATTLRNEMVSVANGVHR